MTYIIFPRILKGEAATAWYNEHLKETFEVLEEEE